MTIEQKKEALRNAASKELSSVYDLYKWKKVTGSENLFVLSGECGSEVRKAYLAGCEDAWGGEIFIDYNPEEDIVGIYIKDRPIQEKFKDDLMVLVEKYAPFKMQLSFDKDLSPLLSRTEKVEPQNFSRFFEEFKKFAMRGNVIDLAIGVVIGSAFSKITSSLVNDLIMPFFAV